MVSLCLNWVNMIFYECSISIFYIKLCMNRLRSIILPNLWMTVINKTSKWLKCICSFGTVSYLRRSISYIRFANYTVSSAVSSSWISESPTDPEVEDKNINKQHIPSITWPQMPRWIFLSNWIYSVSLRCYEK